MSNINIDEYKSLINESYTEFAEEKGKIDEAKEVIKDIVTNIVDKTGINKKVVNRYLNARYKGNTKKEGEEADILSILIEEV